MCAKIEPDKSQDTIARNVVEFESHLLRLSGKNKIDLERFSYGASALPGIYRANIFVNGTQVANDDVELKETPDRNVQACLTPKIIGLINLKTEQLSSVARDVISLNNACTNIVNIIPDSKVEFDSTEQQLNIEIPQAYVNQVARGTVSPELWDSGIPALMLGYNVNTYDSHYETGPDARSVYASINGGLNIGDWYIRHNGSYNWQKDIGGKYEENNSYVQRDISALQGRVVIGESNTSRQLFNTLAFTGIQLASDERMLPDSQRSYAPEIRGVAKTNAKVTVRQLGNIIYETTVSPGAFLINDLYPMGYGGDLDITIQEADGSTQHYTMPYASVAQLLRPGMHKYSFTAGKLRNSGLADNPLLYEATYQRGLNNTFTGYGGAQISENYKAAQVGVAVGSSAGAVSADITQASSQLGKNAGGEISGQSYRASYSKLINETDSNITLAAYRFSSSGYMDFLTAMQTRDAVKKGDDPDSIWRSKNRFSISLNQGLPGKGWGSIYISASMESYWNKGQGFNKQYQMGYSNTYKRLNYSLNASRTQSAFGEEQTSWYINFSLPLWEEHETPAPNFSLRYNQDDSGATGQQASLSGVMGENNKYSYNLSAAHDEYTGNSGGIGGTWQSRAVQLNASYSAGDGYSSTAFGMSGAMIAHSGGVTLSPFNSDNFALIEAKGAEGAKLAGYSGPAIDQNGYVLYPSLIPYQINQVGIDPEGSALDIEFEDTVQKVVPRAGALVKVKFNTHRGTPILITSIYKDEQVPFGSEAFDEKNNHVGTVTQGGMIYARVAQDKGTLLIKWGEDSDSRCQVSYVLAPLLKGELQTMIPQQFNTPCQSLNTQRVSTHAAMKLAVNNKGR